MRRENLKKKKIITQNYTFWGLYGSAMGLKIRYIQKVHLRLNLHKRQIALSKSAITRLPY